MTLALHAATSVAAAPSIDGRWNTFDSNGKPRAVIEVRVDAGQVTGRIVEFHPAPGEPPDPVCEACKGEERGRKIIGLEILRLAPAGDGASWSGTVLDPEEGDRYKAVARLASDGRRLELRGYVGIPLFGRTETWVRAQAP